MNKVATTVFVLILVLSSYHLVRDLLQIVEVDNLFTNILHRSHIWCGGFCSIITIPLDILGTVGAFVVLKRGRVGSLGIIILSSLPLWLLAFVLP